MLQGSFVHCLMPQCSDFNYNKANNQLRFPNLKHPNHRRQTLKLFKTRFTSPNSRPKSIFYYNSAWHCWAPTCLQFCKSKLSSWTFLYVGGIYNSPFPLEKGISDSNFIFLPQLFLSNFQLSTFYKIKGKFKSKHNYANLFTNK